MGNLKLPFKDNAIAFDCETTGLSAKKGDRIIELGYILFSDGFEHKRGSIRFDPEGKKIDRGAFEAHGITDKELEGQPVFSEHAGLIRDMFDNCNVIIGYNVGFDLKFIKEEFKRAGQSDFSWANKEIVDSYKIWVNQALKHRLTDAYTTFVGGKFKAHSAADDIEATVLVTNAMAKMFEIDPTSQSLAEASSPSSAKIPFVIPGDDRLIWGEKGQIVLNFSKKRGSDLEKVDDGMLKWMIRQDFISDDVKKYVKMVINNEELPTKGS